MPDLGSGVGGFDGGIELGGVTTLLARAVAGTLAAAERHMVVDAGRGAVDHYHARLRVALELRGVLQRRGAYARRQAEFGVVGQFQRMFERVGWNDGGHRAEDLFAADAQAVVAIDGQRRIHVVAIGCTLDALAAISKPGAFVAADLYVLQVLLELAVVYHRADVGARQQRIVDLEGFQAFLHGLDKARIDALLHDQAAGGGAALAGGKERPVDAAFY